MKSQYKVMAPPVLVGAIRAEDRCLSPILIGLMKMQTHVLARQVWEKCGSKRAGALAKKKSGSDWPECRAEYKFFENMQVQYGP